MGCSVCEYVVIFVVGEDDFFVVLDCFGFGEFVEVLVFFKG